MRKRALIITDSLGAPRYEPETVSYEDTWVHHVKSYYEQKGYDVFPITQNGLNSLDLRDLARTKLNLYNANIIILQCGVVDSAPRVLKNKEILLARILRLQNPVRYIARKYHAPLSKWRNITLFTMEKFNEHISETYELLKNNGICTIVQIPIAPACAAYIEKSPNIDVNIQKFNAAIKKNCDIYLDTFENIPRDQVEKIFMSDHHHLNKAGHALLSQLLIDRLSEAGPHVQN